MELIYKNNYGASYKINNHPNPNCKFQLVIDTIGLFMMERDIENLLDIIRKFDEPCNCFECDGKRCNKIWTTSKFIDSVIKVDDAILEQLEDLITGTQFMLNMDATLGKHNIN